MGKMEERAVEILVRAKGSKPGRPHCERCQFPTGGGVGPATPASDLSSKHMLLPVFGSLMGSVLQ